MKNLQNQRQGTSNGFQLGDLLQSTAKLLVEQQNAYRKIKKPKWARFKAKIQYSDGNCFSMFSIDFQKDYSTGEVINVDNEKNGLIGIKNWVTKCSEAGLIHSIQIYITLDRFKDTSKMSYDTRILYWNDKFNTIDQFDRCLLPIVRFFDNGSVNLERFKAEQIEIIHKNMIDELERLKNND